MELAQALVQLWQRKTWVLVGIVVAVVAAVGSRELLKSKVYAAAATQMVVDSPNSTLGNTAPDLTPFIARAGIFARLMTSPQALEAIGRAAGIPGTQIVAQGPPEVGLPQAGQQPAALTSRNTGFKLLLNQDPSLPTIDVYTEAPTTRQAIDLANGAVTGFASYLKTLEDQGSVPPSRRVDIRQLGNANGGPVDPGTSTKMAVLIAVAILVIWCGMILYISRMRATWESRKMATVPSTETASVAPSGTAPVAARKLAPVAPNTALRRQEMDDDDRLSGSGTTQNIANALRDARGIKANGDHPLDRVSTIRPAPEPWRDAQNANDDVGYDPHSEAVAERTNAVAKSPFLRHES